MGVLKSADEQAPVPSKWSRYTEISFAISSPRLTTNTGITALLALGIVENIIEQRKIKSLLEVEHNSAEYLHTLVESLRLAFAGLCTFQR